jgi:hypothetical protein
MDEIEERWIYLKHLYFVDHEGAAAALELFERSKRSGRGSLDLHSLLRHHEARPISDPETRQRGYFDSLLEYFSMVEVACLSGFIPWAQLPDEHVRLAGEVLDDPAVRRYYEDHYPLLLPQAHRMRIEGRPVAPPANDVDDDLAPSGPDLFDEFLLLSQPIEMDASIETFLWFLDGGARGGVDIDDTIDVLGNPELLLRHTAAMPDDDPDGLDPLSASVQGFLGFVEFAPRLLDLLECAASRPLLQSAMWHYHGYWLGQMNQHLGSEVRRALRALGAREGAGDASLEGWERDMLAAAQRERHAQELALARLSTGRFEGPLAELVFPGPTLHALRPPADELPSFEVEIIERREEDDEEEGMARGRSLEPA